MTGTSRSTKAAHWLPVFLAAIPPVLLVWTVSENVVDVPFADEWALLPLIDAWRAGRLQIADLWAQHNEHRPVVARVVELALAQWTDWDARYAVAGNLILAVVSFALLASLIRRTFARTAPAVTPWLWLAASVLMFSPAHWENWGWGFQLAIFIAMCAVSVAAWGVARYGASRPGMLILLGAASTALLSFSGIGLALFLVLSVAVLLQARARGDAAGLIRATCWSAAGIGIVLVYFAGYQHPPHHPTPLAFLAAPLDFVAYVLTFLGAPLAPEQTWEAGACGAAGLAIFCVAVVAEWRRADAGRQMLAAWVLLAAVVIVVAMITAVARMGFGVHQALSTRYMTVSTPFWIALLVVVTMAVVRASHRGTVSPRAISVVVAGLVLLACPRALKIWSEGHAAIVRHGVKLTRARDCVLSLEVATNNCLASLYPDPNLVRQEAMRLRALALGPFRVASDVRRALATPLTGGGWIDTVSVDAATETIRVSGWAMDPRRQVPPAAVVVVVAGDPIGRATTGGARLDVAARIAPNLAYAGWTLSFPSGRVAPGTHHVQAYALLADGQAALLDGARSFDAR